MVSSNSFFLRGNNLCLDDTLTLVVSSPSFNFPAAYVVPQSTINNGQMKHYYTDFLSSDTLPVYSV